MTLHKQPMGSGQYVDQEDADADAEPASKRGATKGFKGLGYKMKQRIWQNFEELYTHICTCL